MRWAPGSQFGTLPGNWEMRPLSSWMSTGSMLAAPIRAPPAPDVASTASVGDDEVKPHSISSRSKGDTSRLRRARLDAGAALSIEALDMAAIIAPSQ
jgi:hypothetical protein